MRAVEEDLELLERWRGGDGSAGSALFERYFDELYRFFRGKVKDGVEDLMQQTLVACIEGRDRIRGDAGFRAYLYGVARHRLYAHFRDRDRGDRRFDETMSSLVDLDPSPSRVLDARSEVVVLAEALRRIPIDCQLAVELHYWEGLSTSELAVVLGIPQGTVKSRLRRAKQLLGEQMKLLAGAAPWVEQTIAELDKWAAELRRSQRTGDEPGEGP